MTEEKKRAGKKPRKMKKEEKGVEWELPKITKEEELPKIGKRGVMAKRVAIEKETKEMKQEVRQIQDVMRAKGKEFEEAAKKMLEEGTEKMRPGVSELQSAIQAQGRKFESGVSELQSNIKAFQDDIKSYAKKFYFG